MPTSPDGDPADERDDLVRAGDEAPSERAAANASSSDRDDADRDDADRDVPAVSRGAALSAAHSNALDGMTALLREQARGWHRQLTAMREIEDLSALGAKAGQAQFAQLEMAGSWSISQITATRWQWEAERFHLALPLTLSMLATGDLLVHQATVLLHTTRECTVTVAQAVEAAVLPAGNQLCPSDLRKRVERAVLRIEAEQAGAAEDRHAKAAAGRRTYSKPLQDGMGLAGAVLTAPQLVGWQAAMDALERRERAADHQAGVERTADQRRADLFAALPAMVLAGTAQDRGDQDRGDQDRGDQAPTAATRPALVPWTLGPEQLAAQVVIHVHVPVSTVLDLSSEPGTLERYGPLSAEHVRLLRPRSWQRVLVDADTGRPIALDHHAVPADPDPERARAQISAMLTPAVIADVDEPGHDPSARLARLIDLRDQHCCGPGCSSTVTDRDHLVPYPEGPTSARNLGLASRRCHRAKHAGWTLVRHPDGSTSWTSPLGRTYHRPSPHAPPPHVDLWQEPPPLRRPPPTQPRDEDVDGPPPPGNDRSAAEADAAPPARRGGEDGATSDAATAEGRQATDDTPVEDDPAPF